MESAELAGEDGAVLVGIIADGNDGMDTLGEELVQVFGSMCGGINTDFGEDLNGEGMDIAGRVGAGGVDLEDIAGDLPEDGLGHMGAAGIAGTEDEDFWFGHSENQAPRSQRRK